MGAFETETQPRNNLMRIILQKNGPELDWNEISSVYKAHAGEGVTNWELDMRLVDFIDSLTIGNMIALNTSAKARGGSFRLIIKKDSAVSKLIRLTKLNLIIEVMENVPQDA